MNSCCHLIWIDFGEKHDARITLNKVRYMILRKSLNLFDIRFLVHSLGLGCLFIIIYYFEIGSGAVE